MSKVVGHKCGGVRHVCSVCPTRDSDAMANAVEEDEEEAFTAVDDEDEGAW